ncbi:hypothetical protein D9M70_566400 [compost metagenome]
MPAGMTTGSTTYPRFLPGALRITRPTDCTTSTWELRGVRKSTASSAGTSTPSDRQRTLLRMRQVLTGGSSFSQLSLASLALAFMPPSTCSASQMSRDASSICSDSW